MFTFQWTRLKLIDWAAVLTILAVALGAIQVMPPGTNLYASLGILAGMAVLYLVFPSIPTNPRLNQGYLLIQTSLTGLLLVLSGGEPVCAVPFFIFSAQAVALAPPRRALIWTGVFTLITAGSFFIFKETGNGLAELLLLGGGYFLFGWCALALTQADAARQQNQELLAQLRAVQQQLEGAHQQLREQAIRDPLTGLYNRRYLEETLGRELARSRRDFLPLSLVILDIDHFKRLNDSYGQPCGDRVLNALSDLILHTCRAEDIPCRYEGEKFLVVLPGMPLEPAYERAGKWRAAFEEVRLHAGEVEVGATISLGVASFPIHGEDQATLLARADQALYRAKQGGRNQVVEAEAS